MGAKSLPNLANRLPELGAIRRRRQQRGRRRKIFALKAKKPQRFRTWVTQGGGNLPPPLDHETFIHNSRINDAKATNLLRSTDQVPPHHAVLPLIVSSIPIEITSVLVNSRMENGRHMIEA